MDKDELLDLHQEMTELMDRIAEFEDVNPDVFDEYKQLDLGPEDIHESKTEHRRAIFVLGKALAEIISEDEFDTGWGLQNRMDELIEGVEKDL